MLGLHSTTWIDARGLPLLELGMNGVIVSALEEERVAKSYLTSAAVNKDEAILSWSLIKTPLPLPDPRHAQFTRFTLVKAGGGSEPPVDSRQTCSGPMRELVCQIDASRTTAEHGDGPAALLPSATVQSRDPIVRKLAQTIAGQRPSTEEKIDLVLSWLDRNIAKEAIDTFSALDVLDARRAECQGHAYLYAALMRALDVPTRVVNGLVYSPEFGGFLYHTWAESLTDGGWRAVDPTFGQSRADATHIALVRGETLSDLTPLVDWVGNTRIKVLEAR
jgi:transglutaminase-like putative cysteine protease